MEWSKYNYFFTSKDKFLLYNSLSNSFAELDEEVYFDLVNQKERNLIDIKDKDLVEVLKSMKVIVNDERDDLNIIKYNAYRSRFYSKGLSLTINPTLHCNFACSYCFEEDRLPVYMTEEVEDKIIEHIKGKEPKHVDVDWFGGEPLLAFDRIVSLTKKMQKLNVIYEAGMITNGYLLTEKIINQLPSLNINFMQITVDGLPNTHNSRRPLVSGKGTFDTIVKNIDLLKKINPEIQLTIRINIDHNNKNEFVEIYNFFSQKNYPNTYISGAFVHDIKSSKNLCFLNTKQQVKFLLEMKKEYNLNLRPFFPGSRRYECGIRNLNSIVIGPTGEVYKCFNDVGNKNKIVGNIDDSIETNNQLLLRYLVGADPFDDEKCKACFQLPICGGGCPYQRIANEYEGGEFDTCNYFKENMKEFLEIHYLNKTNS